MATAGGQGEQSSPSVVLRGKSGRRISRHLSFRDSTVSLRVDRSEIDAILSRKWSYQEVHHLLTSQLAVLPGGRDRQGGAVIVMVLHSERECNPTDIGKITTYLSNIPETTTRQCGYTVIVDARKVSWHTAKSAIKSLQLTFADNITQLLMLKPNKFWERHRVGVGVSFHRSRYTFSIVLLDTCRELFHYIGASQLPKELEGSLTYNHEEWMSAQEVLEKTEAGLLALLTEYEQLQEIMEHYDPPANLPMAKDALQLHSEHNQLIKESRLSQLCQQCQEVIIRLRQPALHPHAFSPSKHPDIRDCMSRLEAHMGSLYSNCGLLTMLWKQKNLHLRECLQLRQLEYEYHSHLGWLEEEGKQFLRTHMDIGDSYNAAVSCMDQWNEFNRVVNLIGQQICATIAVGKELLEANHHASQEIEHLTGSLSSQWESFCRLLQERVGLLEYSVSFHEKLQSFLRQLKEWLDRCGSCELPNSVEDCERSISSHEELREKYQSMYGLAMKDGQQLREGLMNHMGMAKGNTPSHSNLSVHLQRVQATIDDTTEKYRHLDREWMKRSHKLHCQLNLCSFRRESGQLLLWVQQDGNTFLVGLNSIGCNAAEATEILGQLDEFEAQSAEIYNTCTQLLSWAQQMDENGSCWPDLIHQESQTLERTVQDFVTRLDQCRETLTVAIEYHTSAEKLWRGWAGLKQQLDAEQFADSVDNCTDQLHQLKQRWNSDSQATIQVFTKAGELVGRLKLNVGLDYREARQQMEDHVMRLKDQQQHVERTWRWRQSCLEAWLAMHQFALDVAMHLDRSSSWLEQMMLTNVHAIQSFVDAQMKFDSFTRQLNQIQSAHNELITKSKEVINQLEQYSCLDTIVYSHTSAKDHVRQLVVELEALLLEVHTQGEAMEKRLHDCLEFYRFYQQVEECSISIGQCGSSIDPLSAVGNNQAMAERLLELTQRTCEQMKTIHEALNTYEGQLREFVEKQHFRHDKMQAAYTAAQEKWLNVKNHLDIKLNLLNLTICFYTNVKKVDSRLDGAQRLFASKDSPVDVETCEQLMRSHEQLLNDVKKNCKNVKAEGSALCDQLSPWIQQRSRISSSDSVAAYCSPVLRPDSSRFRHSLDHLDVASGKEQTSVDHVNQVIMGVELREAHCRELFYVQLQNLKHVARRIKYEMAIREVIQWVDDTGSGHVEITSVSASEQETQEMLQEHRAFMENDATLKNGVVRQIREEAHDIMNDDGSNSPQIKLLLGELNAVWGRFERNLSTKEEQLKVAVEFHEMMSEADTWCSATKKLLSDMEERMSLCESSQEVKMIIKELNVYTTSTKLEHNTRIMSMKKSASKLKWNDLSNLVYQMEGETNAYIQRMQSLNVQLKEQASKFELIEQEEDKKQRKLKQKERVLNELVSTEKVYVADLKTVKETYLLHYNNITLTENVMNRQGVVFVNLESIEKYHSRTFLPLLEKAVNLGVNSVAELFLGQAEKLATLYVSYCQGKTASEQLIVANLSFFNELQRFVKLDLPLSSYLIKPVQRITKYPLLLKEALRYCAQLEEVGCDALTVACKQLGNIVIRTNNAVHLSLIEGFDEPMVEFGSLLYQGTLVLSERTWRAHEKERQVFLFEMGILLCRRQELSLGKIKYVFKQKLMVSDVQLYDVQEDPCKFLLMAKGDQKFLFKASTIEERDKWVETITDALCNLNRNKERDALGRASIRSSLRRNAVTITRSSSLSPTPVVLNNGTQSPRNSPRNSPQNSPRSSPIHFYDPPNHLSRSDSLPSNVTKRGSPILSKKSRVSSRENLTKELENNSDGLLPVQLPVQRTASTLSTSSYGSTNSYNSSAGQALATSSPSSLKRSKSSVVQQNRPNVLNSNNTDEAAGSQRYMVLKDYKPRKGGRGMKLQRDQSIDILHKGEDNWWFGRTSSGEVGYIPREIVENPEPQLQQGSSSPMGGSRRHGAIRRRRGSSHSGDGMKPATSSTSISSMVSLEDEDDRKKVGTEKMFFVLQELVETEKEYVDKMNDVIKDYLPEMASLELPESLVYKDRIVFGNIQDLHAFHSKTFLPALTTHHLKSPNVHEAIAKCFLDNVTNFEMYVKYCENKPSSEALLATPAGAYFDGIQLQLGQKEDISSLLIRPVQRITKYQLLLGQLARYAAKFGLPCVNLEKAAELMTEVPKRANDMMKLSMIEEYPGNIHANGSLLMCDDFMLCEKAHKHGVNRRVYLLESKMVITKLMDDGRCLYKDALNLHNLTLTESLTDSPSRFAVASGSMGNWDRYYIMEAPSAEIKEEWMECIKKILLKDLEMMKALVTGGASDELNASMKPQTVILSDSDEDECEQYQPPKSKMIDIKKETSASPDHNDLYIVTEDCAPPTEGESIFYMRTGQVYEVISKVSDWWQARLVVDMVNPELVGNEGWVAPSFLDRFTGSLEEQQQLMPQQRMRSATTSILPESEHSLSRGMKKVKLRRGMLSFSRNKESSPSPATISNGNRIFSEELSDVMVMVGGTAKLRCSLAVDSPNVKVEWLHNGNPIRHRRAFVHEGQSCVFQIKPVELSDAGNYSCHVTVDKRTTVVSSAKLKVIVAPSAPCQPTFVQSAPSLVSLRWEKPADDGGSPINGYVVTGCDQNNKEPCHVTQWFAQCGGIVRDLHFGHTYTFSVKAVNKVGESPPSDMSQSIQIPYGTVKKFTTQREYSTGAVIGSGRFSEVRVVLQGGCKLAGKMIKNTMGLSVAQQELDMLMMLSHDNIVALEDAYKTSKHFVIVMNMVEGCPLFNHLVEQDCLTEGVAVDCLHQLLSALCYLHTHYIAHLDIKSENVMATNRGVVPHITLIDFGSARFTPIGGEVMMDIPAGSIDFVAPEIVNNKPVSVATDMWAFGVFTYILLSGMTPFSEVSRMATMKDITAAKYNFPSKQFNGISSNAKSFISRLLLTDMRSRLTCSEAIQTPWIQGEISRKSSKSQIKLDVNGLKQFIAKRSLQGSRASFKDRRTSKPNN